MGRKRPIPKVESLSEEVQRIYDFIGKEQSDLACVLIVESYLDVALASLLKSYFVEGSDKSENLPELLFQNALRNFAARADLAFCLGLVTKGFHNNLKTIAKIRNKFAHSYSPITLDDPEIAEDVDSLIPPTVRIFGYPTTRAHLKHGGTRHDKFNFIASWMLGNLLGEGRPTKHLEQKTRGWE